MEERKVYIVTEGEYSDYRIDRVFSTREKAEEYVDSVCYDTQIEEYDIDIPIERKTQVFCITFGLDKKEVKYVNLSRNDYVNLIKFSNSYFYNGFPFLDIYVESDSRERAIKIASERYGMIIAEEQILFPYLRVPIANNKTAFFDFNTKEIVLVKGQKTNFPLPDFIKVRYFDEKEV